jgi:hypothetical protein
MKRIFILLFIVLCIFGALLALPFLPKINFFITNKIRNIEFKDKKWTAGFIENKKLNESSGFAVSHINSGGYWSLNDSGNAPRLYLLNAQGKDLGVFKIKAHNNDWEGVATGPCDQIGISKTEKCVFIADIGDNFERRKMREIYVFPEPKIGPNKISKKVKPALKLKFEMPKPYQDCESILVHQKTGEIFIISKNDYEDGQKLIDIYQITPNLGKKINAVVTKYAQIENINNGPRPLLRPSDAVFDDNGDYFYIRDQKRIYKSANKLQKDKLLKLEALESPKTYSSESLAKIPNQETLLTTSEGKNAQIFIQPIKNLVSAK